MMIEVVIDATAADGELEIEENQGICWTSYVLTRRVRALDEGDSHNASAHCAIAGEMVQASWRPFAEGESALAHYETSFNGAEWDNNGLSRLLTMPTEGLETAPASHELRVRGCNKPGLCSDPPLQAARH